MKFTEKAKDFWQNNKELIKSTATVLGCTAGVAFIGFVAGSSMVRAEVNGAILRGELVRKH